MIQNKYLPSQERIGNRNPERQHNSHVLQKFMAPHKNLWIRKEQIKE
jgi:hypothetical protein